MTYPRTFSHLGIAVDDLDRAVVFYRDVFGLYELHPVQHFDESGTGTVEKVLTEVYGVGGWQTLRVARLVLADGIGVELQEFGSTGTRDGLPVTRTPGVSHFCVQDPDVQGLADRIVAHGGRQVTGVRELYPGRKPFTLAYCADPFGNLIEIDSHAFETTYSPVSYPEP